ncbi:MAG: septum formation initiator family protein [Eubacterium sp.]|nr:septum formation initiator family protein [Eubacterium sp.]
MHSNKRTMIGILAAAMILLAVIVFQSYQMRQKISRGNQQISLLTQETEAEEQRTEEIEQMQKYMQSDEYKEKAAKEKLGLIKDDEIIFKEAE